MTIPVHAHVDVQSTARWVSVRLSERAEQLVACWRRDLLAEAAEASVSDLPDEGLFRHVLDMISVVAQYVRNPALDLHVELRQHAAMIGPDQLDPRNGVDALDSLSGLTIRRMKQDLARFEETCSATSALTVFERLAEGLRTMTSITRISLQNRCEEGHVRQLQRLSEIGAVLRHELRSPLNCILISADVLARPVFWSDRALRVKQLRIIRSAVTHAEELLLDTGNLTSAPGERLPRRMEPLQTVFQAVNEELESLAQSAGVSLTFQHPLPRLAVDAPIVRLALFNLIINAIKYADNAKSARRVEVRFERPNVERPSTLLIEVADNGLGIRKDLQQRIFQRGFRAHPQVAEGTGLGLFVIRERLAEHGGSIHLISEEGVGTTARVMLPVVPTDAPTP